MSFLYGGFNGRKTSNTLSSSAMKSSSAHEPRRKNTFLTDFSKLGKWMMGSGGSPKSGSSESHYRKPEGSSHSMNFRNSRAPSQSKSTRHTASASGLATASSAARSVLIMQEGYDSLQRIFDMGAEGLPEINLCKFILMVEREKESMSIVLGDRTASDIITEVKKLDSLQPNALQKYITWQKILELMHNSTDLDFRFIPNAVSIENGSSTGNEVKIGGFKDSWSLEEYRMVLEKTGYEISPRLVPDVKISYETQKEELNSPFKPAPVFESMKYQPPKSPHTWDQKDKLKNELLSLYSRRVVQEKDSYETVSERIQERMEGGPLVESDMDIDPGEDDKSREECNNKAYQVFFAKITPLQRMLVNERLAKPSSEEASKVSAVLNGSPAQDLEVLIVKSGIDITQSKFKCLDHSTWLNDEPINFYMLMLKERDTALCEKFQGRKPSWYFSSLFINRLMNLGAGGSGKYDYTGVRRWTKKFDVFAQKNIYMPVNINNSHWTLMVVCVEKKEIHFYDSMNGSGTKYLQAAQRWIVDEAKAKKDIILDPSEYKLIANHAHTPQQNNGYDCGVFSTICADYLSDDLPLTCYSQSDMNMFRVKIGAAILRGSLNYTV